VYISYFLHISWYIVGTSCVDPICLIAFSNRSHACCQKITHISVRHLLLSLPYLLLRHVVVVVVVVAVYLLMSLSYWLLCGSRRFNSNGLILPLIPQAVHQLSSSSSWQYLYYSFEQSCCYANVIWSYCRTSNSKVVVNKRNVLVATKYCYRVHEWWWFDFLLSFFGLEFYLFCLVFLYWEW